MYSPKIREDLIPILFRVAKNKKIPMTRLVDQFVQDGLRNERAKEITQELLYGGAYDRKTKTKISGN